MTDQLAKAKEWFEKVVERMQIRLRKQAAEGFDEKFLNAQKSSINSLVDFYQKSLAEIEALEKMVVAEQLKYSELHRDTQRLVLYCSLHNINPNEVFLWPMQELESMAAERKQFVLPMVDLTEENDDYHLTRKYHNTRMISREHITLNHLQELITNA